MSSIPFVKASACGNDFLIIDNQYAPADIAELSRTICDRHNGVGADGVEWVLPASDADLAIRLVNADGSDAEISGNGTRCVAAWFCAERSDQESVVIRTGAGLKICDLTGRDGRRFLFRSSMGAPEIGGEASFAVGGKEVSGVLVSMGNPHFVTFVSEFDRGWQSWAAQIAVHKGFPHGTNVELVRVRSRHEIEVRFWERGVGETLSSGTGSSAAAVASIHADKVKSPVQVLAPGGAQTVRWDTEVLLDGPATILCRGEFFI